MFTVTVLALTVNKGKSQTHVVKNHQNIARFNIVITPSLNI